MAQNQKNLRDLKQYEALKTARDMAAETTRAAMQRAARFLVRRAKSEQVDKKDEPRRAAAG
jgi:hypothetical protein